MTPVTVVNREPGRVDIGLGESRGSGYKPALKKSSLKPFKEERMRPQLTVLIPCKDEEKNIRACIESVLPVADEVLVADSGSTDRTMDIARELGCRIIEREYRYSGDFKNWAIPQADSPWVLIMDADERLTEPLVEEIQEVLENPRKDGYWIFRRNYFMGHLVRFSGWQNDSVLRLFKRDLGSYVGDTDHAEVQVSTGKDGRLKNRMLHYSWWSYEQCFAKMHRYSIFQAARWHEKGRKVSRASMFFRAPLRFLQTYFLRLGFLDGIAGVQVCALTAFYSFMKQARLWELQHAVPQPDPEAHHAGGQESDTRAA